MNPSVALYHHTQELSSQLQWQPDKTDVQFCLLYICPLKSMYEDVTSV